MCTLRGNDLDVLYEEIIYVYFTMDMFTWLL